MNIRNTLLFTFGMMVSITIHAQALPTNVEWVVVLEDPRPARLQGWQRSDYASEHYSQSLELQRTGQKLANQHDLPIHSEWFIESLKVYCIVTSIDENDQAALEELRANDSVKWVQPSNSFSLLPTPKLTQITTTLFNPPELQLLETINGSGIEVALVDSAVDDQHPDLSAGITANIDFVTEQTLGADGESHGTAIAGVIIADQHSGLGVTGIASGAKLMAYRGCWESVEDSQANSHNCSTLSLARALDAVAVSQPEILNLSLSGPKDELLDQLITQIIANGTYVVTAFDPNRPNHERFPSASQGILTVQADNITENADQTIFIAPGRKIVAAPAKRVDIMYGHSIAAAYTSGVLALCAQIEAQLEKEICGPRLLEENKIINLQSLISKLEEELNQEL